MAPAKHTAYRKQCISAAQCTKAGPMVPNKASPKKDTPTMSKAVLKAMFTR